MTAKKVIIYGYGNPGRQDDGLGNSFVEKLEQWTKERGLQGFSFDSNYQLNIEDAAAISAHDLAVFVDASIEEIEDFIFTPVDPDTRISFTTHAASPGYIVDLCRELFGRIPATFLLHIKGYSYSFGEGLSPEARMNLEKALDFMKAKLIDPEALIREFSDFKVN